MDAATHRDPGAGAPGIEVEDGADDGPAFEIVRSERDLAPWLVLASPHSGRIYPRALLAASRLDSHALRRSEDAHVDRLIAPAADLGPTLLLARYARAWIDVNRAPWELDPGMFEDDLPAFVERGGARVRAGLGSIARIVREGEEIYARRLTFAEARARVEGVHQPYHQALAGLLAAARRRPGGAVLIDCHSMPSAAARLNGQSVDLVLGDRFGSACGPALVRTVETSLQRLGYRVARNTPYAGGWTTATYGRPSQGVQALQVEINRALYMDESTLEPHAGFESLRAGLTAVFAELIAARP